MPSTTTATTTTTLTPTFLYLLLTATLGPLLFGFHLAELNAPSKAITCLDTPVVPSPSNGPFLPPCIPTTPSQFGLITSSFTLGGLLGALSAGPLTASRGRLPTMLYASIFAVLGPIVEALSPNIPVLTIGRLISGIGAGAATVVVPIYISEICPPAQKGFWGSATQVMTNGGILITLVLGLFLSRPRLWRVILGVGGVLAGVMAVGLVVDGVESPVWLREKGRGEEAGRVVKRIRGNFDVDVDALEGEEEGRGEEETTLLGHDNTERTASTNRPTLGPWGVLKDPETRTAVFAVCMIMLAQQFTGINSIIMYGVSLLSTLLPTSSTLLNIFVAALNLLVTTTCAPLSDKWGRKTCLILSISGMGISSLLLAISIMHFIPTLSIVAVVGFVASFGFGLGPIPFILASELVGGEAVGATQSWALAVNWSATFVVAQFFPVLNEWLGGGQVYFLFAGMAVGFAGFVAWFVPETKGCRDADEVWGRRKRVRGED